MSQYVSDGRFAVASPDRTRTLFGQTMGLVALTAGFFALGGYLGRNLSPGWTLAGFIAGFVCLIAASIFLDVLNVFLFFLRIFSRSS
jgi:hypothetical protein